MILSFDEQRLCEIESHCTNFYNKNTPVIYKQLKIQADFLRSIK